MITHKVISQCKVPGIAVTMSIYDNIGEYSEHIFSTALSTPDKYLKRQIVIQGNFSSDFDDGSQEIFYPSEIWPTQDTIHAGSNSAILTSLSNNGCYLCIHPLHKTTTYIDGRRWISEKNETIQFINRVVIIFRKNTAPMIIFCNGSREVDVFLGDVIIELWVQSHIA